MKKLIKHHHESEKKYLTIEIIYEFSCVRDKQFFFSSTELSVAVVSKKYSNTSTAKFRRKSDKRARQQNQTFENIIRLQVLHRCDDHKYSNFGLHC